jgi:fructose transport system ATP-binding protein
MMATDTYILEARGLTKRYGGVVAVESIDFGIRGGEVLALIGDNGAGKSTLVKVLCGVTPPNAGDIVLHGEKVVFETPKDARMHGIEVVHQDLALALSLDIAGNLYLGREIVYPILPRPISVMNRRAMARGAKERLKDLEIKLPAFSGVPVANLSGGQRQAVAVARAAAWATDVLFMDEPTAALGAKQSAATLELARRLAERGLGVVIITHTLPHVMEFADRIVVLRHGRKVADIPRSDASPERLLSLIVGFDPGTIGSAETDPPLG